MAAHKHQAAVVFNPIKVDVDALKALVSEHEGADWAETLWLETSEDDPGIGQTREALAKGASVVLAAGGDGTVRCVGETLRGTDAALAIVPSGTGNLLARNLELPIDDMAASVQIAFEGSNRTIDVGIVEAERPDGSKETNAFLVMAGIGLDAQMIANTNPELKKRVGWLAYVDAIFRSLRDSSSVRLRFSVDGSPIRSMTAHTVLVGNCGTLPGNMLLLPDAIIDDGILDVVALRPKGAVGWVQIWVKLVWENGVLRRSQVGRKMVSRTKPVRTLRYMRGAEFVARLDRAEDFELDGDTFGEAIALKAVVDPGALRVRVPA